MTRQYLAGELSLLLGELEVVARRAGIDHDVTALRHQAETSPIPALPRVAVRALALNRRLCWDALARGDIASFNRDIQLCTELHQFGVCAGLLDQGSDSDGFRA